jgi:ABC-type nitrate/sulfonate/bicarbonate transport system substrate-binding protein
MIKLLITLGILFLCSGAKVSSAQGKKVRFSTSAISISELPFKVAQLKGFWREEGLDVETILIRGAVGMQALLAARWIIPPRRVRPSRPRCAACL